MTDAVEASGSTVEEAIDRALEMLGATDDEVEIQIISEGRDGMVRRDEDAKVRVKLRDERTPEDLAYLEDEEQEDQGDDHAQEEGEPEFPEPDLELDEHAAAADAFLSGLIDVLGIDADLTTSLDARSAHVELVGSELGLLIGRHGSTLDALQEVTRAAVQRKIGGRAFVNVDIEGYRARRISILERRVRSAAAKVRRSGRALSLDPMSSYERKIVHDALSDFRGVRTSSEGEEPNRYVVISPS